MLGLHIFYHQLLFYNVENSPMYPMLVAAAYFITELSISGMLYLTVLFCCATVKSCKERLAQIDLSSFTKLFRYLSTCGHHAYSV